MSIVIDGTPAINDIRAIRRYCHHLILELGGMETKLDVSVLYLGCRKDTVLPRMDNPHFREIKSTIPGKLLSRSWATLNFPKLSFWTGHDPNLLHFPGGNTYIPNKSKVVLTTLHGFHQQRIPQFMNPAERDIVLRKLDSTIKTSTHFITVSEANKQELMELWGVAADRITAIPLGISPEFKEYDLSPEAKTTLLKKYGIPEKRFLLFVGALEPHKNIDGIISAYARMGAQRHQELNLVLVGGMTPYCCEYREMAARLGIADNVIFVDYIEPGSPDLAYLYNLADLLVFPTFYEGWASPPLEAMQCGTPAIVSDIPSLQESTGGVSRYCNPQDPEDIAAKITDALDDRVTYDDLRKRGLAFTSQFTWHACAEKTLRLYEQLA